MVKQSRKQQRRSRKQQRRSRKQKRQSRYRRNQRGGAAPFDAPYEALAGAARAAAQVAPLDRYISDLPSLIPKQGGGHYRQRNGNSEFVNVPITPAPAPAPIVPAANSIQVGENILVGGSAPFGDPYTYKLNGGRRHRRSLRNRRQRNQRGGNAPFDAPYSLGYKLPGVNEQFASEGSVNSLYSQNRGAQGY